MRLSPIILILATSASLALAQATKPTPQSAARPQTVNAKAQAAALELRAIFIVCGHNILHGYNRSRQLMLGIQPQASAEGI